MSMPKPPPGEARELLQVAWDIARENGRWSTFAELDRRWDAHHDSDALDALRHLPEGLAFGFGQHPRLIGLTLAGIAACENSDEMLSLFLGYLQHATRVQKTWQPPAGDASALPSLSDEEYARNANVLPAENREKLLQLLAHLLIAEPWKWRSIAGPDPEGHWTAIFDRDVRAFRDLADLDDYWARRYRPWDEQPDTDITMQAPQRPGPEAQAAALLSASPDALACVLLLWIYDRVHRSISSLTTCADFQPPIDQSKTRDALSRLEAQGLIRLVWADLPLPDVILTEAGAVTAKDSNEIWGSRVTRSRAVRNALLAWLHDQDDNPQGAAPLTGFLQDRHSIVGGHITSTTDLDAAAAYLSEKKLIHGTAFIDQQRGPAWAYLTADGIDCMEHGGDVAEYLTPWASQVTYTFNGPITGTNVAVGDHARQNATLHGIDTDALRILVQAIIEALPGLDLEAHYQKDARDTASQVITETEQHQPDRKRLRAAMGKLRNVLAASAKQSLAAVLSSLIDYELTKAGLPPSH